MCFRQVMMSYAKSGEAYPLPSFTESSGMNRRLIILGIVLIMSTPSTAADQQNPFESGNSFIRLCDSSRYVVACTTFTMGVFQGYQLGTAKSDICLPSGVDTGQLGEVGRKYIRENPERAHWTVSPLLVNSWLKAFPCPKALK